MSVADDPLELAAALAPVTDRLLVIDFDGTISHIVSRPDDATPVPGVRDALLALSARTKVALVSGRPVADLRSRFGGLPLAYAGGHGAEIIDVDGTVAHLVDVSALSDTLDLTEEALRKLVDHEPGWLVERKPASLAVHHRLAAPESVEEYLPRAAALLEHHADRPPGFEVLSGKAVMELRPSTVDKGRALAWLIERTPDLMPVVIGDDVTDEDAFQVGVERGGTAIVVAEEPRETAAAHRLVDPDAVVAFLTALARTKDT